MCMSSYLLNSVGLRVLKPPWAEYSCAPSALDRCVRFLELRPKRLLEPKRFSGLDFRGDLSGWLCTSHGLRRPAAAGLSETRLRC
jgi:hypothetical protein